MRESLTVISPVKETAIKFITLVTRVIPDCSSQPLTSAGEGTFMGGQGRDWSHTSQP